MVIANYNRITILALALVVVGCASPNNIENPAMKRRTATASASSLKIQPVSMSKFVSGASRHAHWGTSSDLNRLENITGYVELKLLVSTEGNVLERKEIHGTGNLWAAIKDYIYALKFDPTESSTKGPWEVILVVFSKPGKGSISVHGSLDRTPGSLQFQIALYIADVTMASTGIF